MTISTTNDFLLGVRGDGKIASLFSTKALSKEEALNLAAWLVALADEKDEFPALLEKVQSL